MVDRNVLHTSQSYLSQWKQEDELAWVKGVKGLVLKSMLVVPFIRLFTQLFAEVCSPALIAAAAAVFFFSLYVSLSTSSTLNIDKLKVGLLLQLIQIYFLVVATCTSPDSKERWTLMSTVLFCVYELPSFHPRWLVMVIVLRQYFMWHIPCALEGTCASGYSWALVVGAFSAVIFLFTDEVRCRLSELYRFCIIMDNKEAKITAILQAIPEALAVITLNQKLVSSNLLMQNLLQSSQNNSQKPSNLTSIYCFENLETERPKSVPISEEIHSFLNTSNSKIAVFGVTKSENVFYEWKGTKCQWDNEVACILTVSDITTWLQTQRHLQAESNSKTALLKFVSHELKTPANAIINLAAEIKDAANLSTQQQHELGIVVASTHYFVSVVNDLLDFTRIMSGKFTLMKEEFNLKQEMKETVDLVTPQCTVKGLYLTLQMDDLIPDVVFSDPYRLRQVLLNLLGNAVKFTFQGSIRVMCMLTDHNSLQISVKDTGIGISPEKLAQLSESFKGSDTEIYINPNNCGLGLYISNKITRTLGSTGLRIHSKAARGTEITFEVDISRMTCMDTPLGRRDSTTDISDEFRSPISVSSECLLGGHTDYQASRHDVLIVDDLDFNRLVLVQLLGKHSISVDEAASGLQAVSLIYKHSKYHHFYRLILMDLEMAEMDGFVATEKIRQLEYRGKLRLRPIIIACSAHTGPEIVEKCHTVGMDDFLEKPINRVKLQSILSKYYVVTS